jgi:xanthine dehydrogenase accessory factor
MTDIPGKPVTAAIQRLIEEGSTGVLITLIGAAANVGAKLLVAEAGASAGSLGAADLDAAVTKYAADFLDTREEVRSFKAQDVLPELVDWAHAQLLFERIQPEPRLVICGAGHVGASLARLAGLIGYRVKLIDDRAVFLTRTLFADERIELIAASSWENAVRDAVGNGRGVSVAVVTRGHNQDEECLRAVTANGADYVGLIGSKRRTNIVLDRLRQAGTDEGKLRAVHAPVGLDIGAVTPEEVALAIMAEIVAARRGGKGGSLSAWRRTQVRR